MENELEKVLASKFFSSAGFAQEIEKLVNSFEGVSSAFVIRAGKEIRAIINHEEVDDLRAMQLANEIAQKIQVKMEYSGQIKVTVIRQTRAVELAK
mgnify:CR=1 FL=1